MLEQSLYRAKGISLWLTSFLMTFVYSGQALSSDLGNQATIVETHLRASSADRALAQALAQQARERIATARGSPNLDLGPLVKLWCGAAITAPNPENLVECAQFRFKAVDQMTNPQPSEEIVRMRVAQKSLIMVRAALEIAGGNPNISDALRYRLKSSADCFRSFISGVRLNKDCN